MRFRHGQRCGRRMRIRARFRQRRLDCRQHHAAARLRRRAAAERACLESAFRDAARFGSRWSARVVARDRFTDGFLRFRLCPAR